MTDPEVRSTPESVTLVRRLRSIPLAAILSAALVLAWIGYLVVAPVSVPPPPLQSPPAPTVDALPQLPDQMRILLWRDVLGPDALTAFQAESDLEVTVERYNTFQDLLAIMDGDRLTHDLVLASGVGVPTMIERKLLQLLPIDQLPRASGLDPTVLKRAEIYDSGNAYSLPFFWGTVGLAFDRAKVAERLGPDVVVDSWSLLFDPVMARALSDCGIQVVDAPGGVFPIALTHLKLPHDSAAVEDTDAAVRLWESVRSSIAKFSTSDVVENLARGDVCVAMAASGDAYQAAVKARASGATHDIVYAVPSEGTVLWHVVAAIPTMAAHPEHAVRLMDYLMRPEVAARITNATGFISAVQDAGLYIKPEIKNDPALNPGVDNLANAVPEMAPGPAGAELRQKFWRLINTSSQQTPAPN